MASELQVTTLKGNPTGANANQILVPTGQKIVGTNAGSIVAPGAVINVVNVQDGTTYNHASATDAGSGIQASITPTYSNSKILLIATGVTGSAFTSNFGRGLWKKSISGGSYTTVGSEFFTGGNFAATYGNRTIEKWSYTYFDSPATTSSITYQLFVRVLDGNNMWWGRWGQDVNWTEPTTITLMEIAQ